MLTDYQRRRDHFKYWFTKLMVFYKERIQQRFLYRPYNCSSSGDTMKLKVLKVNDGEGQVP